MTARRRTRVFWSVLLLAGVVVAWLGFWRYHLKRFQTLRPGVLYRVAQPSEFGLEHLARWHGARTIVSLQLFDWRLHDGMWDLGEPSGTLESEFVRELGLTPVQWPMGEEACWPWPTPWQFEEFFRVLDDPANHPVVIHCMGGRHRTGTLSALFRLEYDRWGVEQALAEMYSFDFGGSITLQEHNLRTYLPRPLPDSLTWQTLATTLGPLVQPPADYADLVQTLKVGCGDRGLQSALTDYVRQDRPFALPLLVRLADGASPALRKAACHLAEQRLGETECPRDDWAASAALLADYGTLAQQERLLHLLCDTTYEQASPARFDQVAMGVMNRYTVNRVPYLRVLLGNTSRHLAPAAAAFRYCDTAVARLAVIADRNLLAKSGGEGDARWDQGRQAAQAWLDEHPEAARLAGLTPPAGHKVVQAGPHSQEEDLRRMR